MAVSQDEIERATESTPLLREGIASPTYDKARSVGGIEDDRDGSKDASDRSTDNEQQSKSLSKPPRMRLILPALAIGIFLSACDQTIIVSSYAQIGSEFRALDTTSWISTAYLMTMTAAQPLYGKLSDIFGRKNVLFFAYALFALGCLLCGFSSSFLALVLARALTGVGAGGMNTTVSIIINDLVDLKDRGAWQSAVNLVFAAGASSGAPLGGLFATHLSWRWAFIVQPPLILLATVCVQCTLHTPQPSREGLGEKVKRIDFLGSGALVITIFSLILGLDRGSNDSWSSPLAVVPLVLVLPLFLIYVFVEGKISTEPIMPLRIFCHRSLLASYFCNFFALAGWFTVIFYVPLLYQAKNNMDALQAGLRLLPGIIASVVGSLLAGFVMKKSGKFYLVQIIVYSLIPIGTLFIALFSGWAWSSTWGISAGLFVGGSGSGAGLTTSLIALIANAETADRAIVTACSFLFRSLGTVIGLASLSAVLQSVLKVTIRDRLKGIGVDDVGSIVEKVRKDFTAVKGLPEDIQTIVRASYAHSIQAVLLCAMSVSILAVISSVFVRQKRLSQK